MVEDEKIKTTVSPFAMKEGEIKTFDGKDGYVSINQIIHRINLWHITEIHFKILELVNEFEFMTSRQIYQILVHRNIDIKSQDKLNNKLEQLIKTKILTRYYFSSEDGKCIYRVFCLEKMGKYLLNSRNIECKWQPTDNTKPVSMIKKRLAGNQIIIAYMRKVQAFDSYVVKPAITAKQSGKIIKANAGVRLTKRGVSIDFIYEAVRREEDWETKFEERMRLYKEFYENFVQFDSGYERAPQLILVAEDEKHMVEIFKIIITKGLQINNMRIYFTQDLSQNATKLDQSLIEFGIDENGKYRMNTVEVKLLG